MGFKKIKNYIGGTQMIWLSLNFNMVAMVITISHVLFTDLWLGTLAKGIVGNQ